jgi:hypothetical protein
MRIFCRFTSVKGGLPLQKDGCLYIAANRSNTPIGVFSKEINLSKLPKSALLIKINNRNN